MSEIQEIANDFSYPQKSTSDIQFENDVARSCLDIVPYFRLCIVFFYKFSSKWKEARGKWPRIYNWHVIYR